MGCSPSGSCVCGILQARILEWVAMSFSRVSSWSNQCLLHCRQILYHLSYLGSPLGCAQPLQRLQTCIERHAVCFSYASGLWAGAFKVPRGWQRENQSWVNKTVVSQKTLWSRLEWWEPRRMKAAIVWEIQDQLLEGVISRTALLMSRHLQFLQIIVSDFIHRASLSLFFSTTSISITYVLSNLQTDDHIPQNFHLKERVGKF